MLNRESVDEPWYGTLPVLLIKENEFETEEYIGYAAPFGGIMVRGYKDEFYTEKPHSWWENEGFEIAEPALMERVRKSLRVVRNK